MEFKIKQFSELTLSELYEILKARAQIFVVEQKMNCQDMDDIDYKSTHFFIEYSGKVIAYLRAFEQNKKEIKIGRVLTVEHGKGIGRTLMTKTVEHIRNNTDCDKILINSQKHAVGFYKKFGFKITSGEFMEEGVPHISMELVL